MNVLEIWQVVKVLEYDDQCLPFYPPAFLESCHFLHCTLFPKNLGVILYNVQVVLSVFSGL